MQEMFNTSIHRGNGGMVYLLQSLFIGKDYWNTCFQEWKLKMKILMC